jgi:eukaryotic-like serine/threonine-protein kinase
MSPEVHRLFEAAVELPSEQRVEYLESQSTDPDVRRAVLALLAHDRLAEPFFADVFGSAAASVLRELDLQPGARVGAFTIVRMLGRGGMGAVYLAERIDGGFAQTVAIKVIQSPNPDPRLLERFQQERQILARLNHPNIARLLDGGETPAGSPYFVMEYVSGEEVDRYCDRHAYDLKSRLRLIQDVSAAVQYAHENLVVHRDLKPGNILVGEDASPKLLDFGIAKLVSSQPGPASSTRVLTPEYASPEQVRGDAITTAADIYSLGAVLYRLLTGKPPHDVQNLAPLDAARMISEEEVPAATRVPADVAAILRKALHTDPAHRYRSADEFRGDIQRYLDGDPVIAVPDSFSYKTAKFLRRHWIPVLALASVAIALVAGAGVAVWQKRRAERRFAEVRQLSNKFLFEFEGAIHDLSGAIKARELLIRTAQEYLDRLAADAGSDPELVHELAEAYQKLGDIEGSPIEGNTGDSVASLRSYRRAVELRDSVGDAGAAGTNVRTEYLHSLTQLANAEATSGDETRALALCEKAVAVAETWIQKGSNDGDLLTATANAYSQLSTRQREKGDFEGAVTSADHALTLQLRVQELNPGNKNDMKMLRRVATRYWAVGSAQKFAGHSKEAVTTFTTTRELMRQVAERDPRNSQSRRELLGASLLLAGSMVDLLHKEKKSPEQALPLWQDAWTIGTQLLHDDPANALVEADVTLVSMGLGSTLEELGRPEDALKTLEPAVATQQRRYNASPENRTAGYYLALLHVASAECRRDLHQQAAALKSRLAAKNIFDHLVAESPTIYLYRRDKAANLEGTGDTLAALGDRTGALAMYREGLDIAEHLPDDPSSGDSVSLIERLRTAVRAR